MKGKRDRTTLSRGSQDSGSVDVVRKGGVEGFANASKIGYSQKGPHHKRFVHVDTLERKALWSY